MLITSNNGLWRYHEIGDTGIHPDESLLPHPFSRPHAAVYQLFGEEPIVDNAERALLAACRKTGAVVSEYSVAPCYMLLRERAHEWIVEFEREPTARTFRRGA